MWTIYYLLMLGAAFATFAYLGEMKRSKKGGAPELFVLAQVAFFVIGIIIAWPSAQSGSILLSAIVAGFAGMWWHFQKPKEKKEEPKDPWKDYREQIVKLAEYKPDPAPALQYLEREILAIDHPTNRSALKVVLDLFPRSVPSFEPAERVEPHEQLIHVNNWRRKMDAFYMDKATAFVERYRKYTQDTEVASNGDFVSGAPIYPPNVVETTEEFVRTLPFAKIQQAIDIAPALKKHFGQTQDLSVTTIKHYMKLLLDDFKYYASIPPSTRFEHMWLLGPQGSGKTQTIQYLITRDLDKAASILVMDSQGDLVRNVSTIASIQDRLLLIEPETVSVNPFDLRGDAAIDLLTYVFGALGEGAEFTPRQQMLYQFGIRLMQEVPNATLLNFVDLLTNGLDPYEQYVGKLATPAQMFFRDDFRSKGLQETKDGVGWRLKLLLSDPTFERMFTRPTNVDLRQALDQGKVVVVDTNKQKLGNDRSSLFGRFMIAYLLYASQQRATQAQSERTPVYAYIDEAHEYLQDDSVATILDQARKMKIAMVLANQRSSQVKNANMLDALMATSIKLIRSDTDDRLPQIARVMRAERETLANVTAYPQTFSLYVRGNSGPFPAFIPFGTMEALEHVSEPRRTLKASEPVAVRSVDRDPEPVADPTKSGSEL